MKKVLLSIFFVLTASSFLIYSDTHRPPKRVSLDVMALPLKEGVSLWYKPLSSSESRALFHYDFLRRGYTPVQITIQNHTDHTYFLSPDAVALSQHDQKKVMGKVNNANLPRTIGLKVASFFFWPLMIPSSIDSLKSYLSNRSLKKTISAKILKEESVAPYSTVHRVLFVPSKEYQENFSISLKNLRERKEVSFHPKKSIVEEISSS